MLRINIELCSDVIIVVLFNLLSTRFVEMIKNAPRNSKYTFLGDSVTSGSQGTESHCQLLRLAISSIKERFRAAVFVSHFVVVLHVFFSSACTTKQRAFFFPRNQLIVD